ncbi:Alpha/beta hydrolase fold-3 [Abortiporus biennis]|nr:Alpha/beta hydrolase fold-3 [Abortiporus biennis]
MSKPFPLLIWIHGGAFIVGSPEIDDLMLRKIAIEAKVSVVNVNHRHAPEYPYPIPLNDCYEALKWAVKHSSELSASPAEGLIIGGCSSGASLAAGLALRARDDPFFNKDDGTLLTGQLLQCPALGTVPSQYEAEILSPKLFKDGPLLTAANSTACLEHYRPDSTSPYVSPLLAPSLGDIASAYFQVCGMDLLRDAALLYERLLRENGVTTKLDTYAGYPHAAHHILIGLEITNRFQQDFVNGVRWLIDNPKQ